MINPPELLTDELYFSDTQYMSVSRYKAFNYCEVSGLYGEKPDSTALLIGSYVDHYFNNTLDKFKEEHPEIFSSRGSTKGELKADFKVANDIIEKLSNDNTFMKFMSGEKQCVMSGEIKGVPFKIKMDSYTPHKAIVDLKIMRSITNRNGEYYDFISQWGYDTQLACYREIVRQNTGETLPCFIAVATKENPINTAIIYLPDVILDRALYKVEENIERFYQVMQGEVEPEGCGKCSACISKRTETPIISMEDIIEGGII